MKKLKYFILCCLCFPGCKKLVTVPAPLTSSNSANVYASNASATAALTGIYATMSTAGLAGGTTVNTFVTYCGGLSADELTLYSFNGAIPGHVAYYTNALNNMTFPILWNTSYNYIYTANAAILGLQNSQITPSVRQQLLGEAKFIRALSYFYLVNLYGDIPLVTSVDYTKNALLGRSSQDSVYGQIVTDLKDAEGLLSPTFPDATLQNTSTERVRPTSWAAAALLARVYLYTGDWANANAQSSIVLADSAQFKLSPLNNAFLKASLGNNEAIWQLQPVNLNLNTEDGRTFIIPSTGPSGSNPVYLNQDLLNAFESGDKRRTNWVDSVIVSGQTYFFPYKYKIAALNVPVNEYQMVLRLGEQYLIRAEARLQQGDLANAAADLNRIRSRAGLANYGGSLDRSSLLNAVMHERQVELFTEWGHRWLDLKRNKMVDSVMISATPRKGGTWTTNAQLFPIPANELLNDLNLTQNPGY